MEKICYGLENNGKLTCQGITLKDHLRNIQAAKEIRRALPSIIEDKTHKKILLCEIRLLSISSTKRSHFALTDIDIKGENGNVTIRNKRLQV